MSLDLRQVITATPLFFAFAGYAGAQPPAKDPGPFFNIMDYGAHNDGSANAAASFQAAIAAVKKAGGGTVFVPAGHYISGPIEMVSNMTLYFDAGAIVQFPAVVLPFHPGAAARGGDTDASPADRRSRPRERGSNRARRPDEQQRRLDEAAWKIPGDGR